MLCLDIYQSNHYKHRHHNSKQSHLSNCINLRNDTTKKQNEMDQDWIYEWLFSKNVLDREKEVEVKPKLTIGEFKQLLKDAIVLNDQLAEQRDNLVKYIEKDESSWQFEYRKANKIKEKLVKVQAQLHDAEQLSLIKQKITKVQRKRESSRRRKARRRSEKEEAAKRREELHRKIDEKFTEEENKKLEKKRELELQKEVDKIFFEVRQKKAEANKALNLLKLLRKLRHLRKESAEKKGAHTSVSSTQAFESTIERLEKLMKRQRDIYMDEEKTMQVMMEVEQEENKEKEKEIQRRHLRDRAKRVVKEQLKCLFGHEEAASPEDPIYPFRQYYLQAENNPQALLEIRHQWDSFLVTEGTPGSSSIPVDWIIPDTPNDETWASCLDSA
ncbi:programmed cell death protein 7-like [Ptychodera flava]|uniref:programmed cell death protein 7-like n=1 Tax=Ptychodera flava TaxID=63121 RepID=UPI00396A4568